ncbi:hypothetical protein BQ8482_390003 [Mesorhizobium delmotii]|uniref:Uncharacterized protein n=1 Tax=Mesorhizobium delmotii TaxID=1631247 RepID=A0A2P9ASQ7_9HYPH|nr:hypothetical protein BQ8482_390003 [Mesorhizobium delmotii]
MPGDSDGAIKPFGQAPRNAIYTSSALKACNSVLRRRRRRRLYLKRQAGCTQISKKGSPRTALLHRISAGNAGADYWPARSYSLGGAAASALADGVTLQLSGFGSDLQMVAPVSSSTD